MEKLAAVMAADNKLVAAKAQEATHGAATMAVIHMKKPSGFWGRATHRTAAVLGPEKGFILRL